MAAQSLTIDVTRVVRSRALHLLYPSGYNPFPVNTLIRSDEFSSWLKSLGDRKGRARILARLDSAALGNFGDCEPVGSGVSEMRIHYGPGYRVYYTRRGLLVYVLLVGGNKSTQTADIRRAKAMAKALEVKP